MKKILFVEILHHHGLINTMATLSEDLKEWKSIFIVTDDLSKNSNISFMENISKYEISTKKKNGNRYIYTIKKIVNMYLISKEVIRKINFEKPDVVVFNTIDLPIYTLPIYKYIRKKKSKEKPKICVIIHNSHTWSLYGIFIEFKLGGNKIKDYFRIISKTIFNSIISKNVDATIKLADYIVLPRTMDMCNNLVIPYKIVKDNTNYNDSNKKNIKKVSFVIPGIVDIKRKDYKSVIVAMEKLLSNNEDLINKIELVLLGKIDDGEILKIIEESKYKDNFKYFLKFIQENEFNQYINNAHYVLIPFYEKSLYGKYKMSGAFDDGVSMGIPIIIPNTFCKGYKFSNNIIKYEYNNLAEKIEKLFLIAFENSIEYKKMCKDANEALILNTKKINSEKLEIFINNITNS